MSRDLRNEFLNAVQLTLSGFNDCDLIIYKITQLLDKYELSERSTDIVTVENSNVELIKLYASSLLVNGLAKSTVNQYVRELKVFLSTIGNRDLKTVSVFDIRAYLAKRKQENNLTNTSLNNVRGFLSAFYVWLTDEDIISKNPCKTIKPIKNDSPIKKPFSIVELDALKSACKNQKERTMVEFLLTTGVRVSEFCDLEIKDIDFPHNKVHIKHGKGGKERYTYMTDLTKEHLIKCINNRVEGPLFLNHLGKKYAEGGGGVRGLLHTIEQRAGISNVHPHRFRRTFATMLASRGMPIQEIQKLMGHSNINTTMLYVTVLDADTQHAYNKYAI